MGFGTGAGKGSLPRAVNGDAYRDNYESIFRKKKKAEPYPDWVCAECGNKYGYHEVNDATWHVNRCDICGEEGIVTEPRDFGFLNPAWKIHKTNK